MLAELFIEIFGGILFERGRQGLGKFFAESPARKAINATADDFDNALVGEALTRWCQSEDFVHQIEAMRSGRVPRADDALVDSFIEHGKFSDGLTGTHRSAHRVLEAFFKQLKKELYRTEDGLLIESERAELRHVETQGELHNISRQIEQSTDRVEAAMRRAGDNLLPRVDAQLLAAAFDAQLRIAGHFKGEDESRRAIYLDDDGLYVNRKEEEKLVLDFVTKFIEANKEGGKWISIVGDAGHGKSCLLWYLFHRLKNDGSFLVLPLLADHLVDDLGQEISHAIRHLASGRRGDDGRIVVLVDTLDILVGINDAVLARALNALRAAGCLLITTSRPHEAERFYRLCNRDEEVPLKRYTDKEFALVTRRYIDKAYPRWSSGQKEAQFRKVAELLEQRRDIARELDLEPLILRMIFEAYVPEDITQDINTQKVYEKFWRERVLEDRQRALAEQRARAAVCRFLAREIIFGRGALHAESIHLDYLSARWEKAHDAPLPDEVITRLVSSGVLQWAMGKQAVRFFHQTFLEYAAAFDLLQRLTAAQDVRDDLEGLYADVVGNNFFRVPVLKQLAVQDYYYGKGEALRDVVSRLRAVNSELAAQLVLEVVGKVENAQPCVEVCAEWITKDKNKIGAVLLDTVRHYPSKHVGTAFALLASYLDTPQRNAIYAVCEDSFAVIAPEPVREFLRAKLKDVMNSPNLDEKNAYKRALLAAWHHGSPGALDDLAELFKRLSDGQRQGLLEELARKVSVKNAAQVARFLTSEILPALLSRKCGAKVWKPAVELFSKVRELLPETAAEIARTLLADKSWLNDTTSAVNVGKMAGETLADKALLDRALADLSAADHATRMMSAAMLCEAHRSDSDYIIDGVLRIPPRGDESDEYVDSLFKVVSRFENVDASKIFVFLERWTWTHGSGTALRETFERLAAAAPAESKAWLMRRVKTRNPLAQRAHFVFLSLLAEKNVEIFSPQDLASIYEAALESTNEVRRLFASLAGRIAVVDERLADKVITSAFGGNEDQQNRAVIMSLEHCAKSHPQFVLDQTARVFTPALASHRLRYLQAFFRVLKSLAPVRGEQLLATLDEQFNVEVAEAINDGEVLTEFLRVLKISAYSNPPLAYRIASRCQIVSAGVAKDLAALYSNISDHSDDPALLSNLLEGFSNIAVLDGVHNNIFRNALGRALPKIDRKLGGRHVAEMITKVYLRIKDERILVDLLEAADRVRSFTTQDRVEMLKRIDPAFVQARGVLLRKRKGGPH
jgi:hypothetical protein